AKRAAFADKLRSTFPGIEIAVASDAASATAGASIITLMTRAREPVICSSMLARGAHVNAAGAITNERREFAQDLFPRARAVAVDRRPASRALRGECIDWYDAKGAGDWSPAQRFADIVAAGRRRPADIDISLFKPMGMGISDVALGIEIIARAQASGSGRTM